MIFDEAGLEGAILRLEENSNLAANARHYGYALYFLAQRFKQVPPTLRSNITTLYAFRQSPLDAKEMARQWYQPGEPLLLTPQLNRYEFLKTTGWRAGTWHRIRPRN